MNINLKLSYRIEVRNLSDILSINISDFSKDDFIQALYLDNGRLAINYAGSYLMYPIENMAEQEKEFFLSNIKEAFDKAIGKLKKVIAEYYLGLTNMAGDVFIYYSSYLLNDDNNAISQMIAHGNSGRLFASADMKHLDIISNLLIYSLQKVSKRRQAISEIDLQSYRLIANKVIERKDIEKVIHSMEEVKRVSGKEFISMNIREIETAFAERTYNPLTIEQIIGF